MQNKPVAIWGISGVALLIVAALVGYHFHKGPASQSSLVRSYAPYALKAPFVLQHGPLGKNAGTMYEYTYSAGDLSGPAALAALQQQFSGNGYQVVASKPDVTNSDAPYVNRENILGDFSLMASVNPDPTAPGSTYAQGPVQVVVEVSAIGKTK